MQRRVLPVIYAAVLIVALAQPASAATSPTGRWMPGPREPWQWLLDHPLNLNNANDMNGGSLPEPTVYGIDGFDNPSSTVAALHARGKKVICYISVGSWENYRSDAAKFPAAVKGRSNGWPGEKWLDIRRTDVLRPIMAARLDMCAAKGFDALEPDNMDGYSNRTGFPLTGAQQITYNRMIADLAHERGLSVLLKGDPEQAAQLEPYFDFALNEECAAYDECDAYRPFVRAGKTVLNAEYEGSIGSICASGRTWSLNSAKFNLSLNGPRQVCP